MITFDPLSMYNKAQADIDIIAKRIGISTSDTAKKMLELKYIANSERYRRD